MSVVICPVKRCEEAMAHTAEGSSSSRNGSSNGGSAAVPHGTESHTSSETAAPCRSDDGAADEAASNVFLQLLMRQYQSEHATLGSLVSVLENRASELQRELHAEQERTGAEHDIAESLREQNAILRLEMQQHALQHSKECMELRDKLRRSEEERERLRQQVVLLQKQQQHHQREQPLPLVHAPQPALTACAHTASVPQAKMYKSINGLSTEHDVSSTLTSLLSYCYSDKQGEKGCDDDEKDDDGDENEEGRTRRKKAVVVMRGSPAVKLVQGAVLQKELRYYQRMISDMLAVMHASGEVKSVSSAAAAKVPHESATRATRQLHAELLFMTTVQLPLLQREVARRGELLDGCHDAMSAMLAMCAATRVIRWDDNNNNNNSKKSKNEEEGESSKAAQVSCSPRSGKSLPAMLRRTVHAAQANVDPRRGYYTMDSDTNSEDNENNNNNNNNKQQRQKDDGEDKHQASLSPTTPFARDHVNTLTACTRQTVADERAERKTKAKAKKCALSAARADQEEHEQEYEKDDDMHAAASARCARTMAALRRLCASEAQRHELHRRRHHRHHTGGRGAAIGDTSGLSNNSNNNDDEDDDEEYSHHKGSGAGGNVMAQYSARVQHTERQFANAKIDQVAALALQTIQALCRHMTRCRTQQAEYGQAARYAATQVERLEKMLDRCRDERDDARQELDALRLVVDALNSERVRLRHELVAGN